jgi:hypothetical protein
MAWTVGFDGRDTITATWPDDPTGPFSVSANIRGTFDAASFAKDANAKRDEELARRTTVALKAPDVIAAVEAALNK